MDQSKISIPRLEKVLSDLLSTDEVIAHVKITKGNVENKKMLPDGPDQEAKVESLD